ncbi:MAG: hypothetical protein H7289_04700 [Mucilaginibacter sp.]|nr:hypothetical protein [Mucilaginibacter sp.]
MVFYNKLLLIFAVSCILLGSCKLDDPMLPVPNPNFNTGQLVLGITVVGKDINDDYLTHAWKVETTVEQYYDKNDIVVSGKSVPNKFSSISINDKTKKCTFNGLAPGLDPEGYYILSTSYNVLFIAISDNPFAIDIEGTTRISNLTARAMTWIVIASTPVIQNGQAVRKSYQIIFSR